MKTFQLLTVYFKWTNKIKTYFFNSDDTITEVGQIRIYMSYESRTAMQCSQSFEYLAKRY